jgi:hypothetical protein
MEDAFKCVQGLGGLVTDRAGLGISEVSNESIRGAKIYGMYI